jgi:hypothetical protein
MGRSSWVAVSVLATISILVTLTAQAYPPGVGILAKNRSCVSCHPNNGPWADEAHTIIDILDATTKQSLEGADGVFVIEVSRGQTRTVQTVIGRSREDTVKPPQRNAWLYIDTTQLATSSLSKFAPGWEVNLPMSCRVVGDEVSAFEGAHLTSLPMTILPTGAARDAELELQALLTAGESVKNKAAEGLISNYFVRKVRLKVIDP